MNRKSLDLRLQELGIYYQYYYKKELKPLAEILEEDESLNCIFTGVEGGARKLVAVTDRRILIIQAGLLTAGGVKSIPTAFLKSAEYEKKLFFPKARIITEENSFLFENVQPGQKELFDWAIRRILP